MEKKKKIKYLNEIDRMWYERQTQIIDSVNFSKAANYNYEDLNKAN